MCADIAVGFGATEGFGAIAGWEAQNTGAPKTNQRANALDNEGNEVASELFDEKTEITSTYKCIDDTNTIPPSIGAIVNSYDLTGISISTIAEDFATMSLTGHQHTANTHTSLNLIAHGITIVKCFGCTDFTGDTPGATDSPISSSCDITCEHTDQNDLNGDHLVGENYNAKVEVKTTYAGAHTAVATGFDITVDSDTDENTGFVKTEVTGVKTLGVMAPPA